MTSEAFKVRMKEQKSKLRRQRQMCLRDEEVFSLWGPEGTQEAHLHS
jgi:hypothetical protein